MLCFFIDESYGRGAGLGRGRGVGVTRGAGVGVSIIVGDGDACGVTVDVAVGLGGGSVGVDVGVGLSHSVCTVSIRQPSLDPLLSLPIRHRNLEVCPWGSATAVVINPAELPVQAWRPPNGLPQHVLIMPL